MDILTEHLDAFKDNVDLKPVIRIAAARGLLIMNKYYSRTDDSEIYRIAMSRYPIPSLPYNKTNLFRSSQSWLQDAVLQGPQLARGVDRRGQAPHHDRLEGAVQA